MAVIATAFGPVAVLSAANAQPPPPMWVFAFPIIWVLLVFALVVPVPFMRVHVDSGGLSYYRFLFGLRRVEWADLADLRLPRWRIYSQGSPVPLQMRRRDGSKMSLVLWYFRRADRIAIIEAIESHSRVRLQVADLL